MICSANKFGKLSQNYRHPNGSRDQLLPSLKSQNKNLLRLLQKLDNIKSRYFLHQNSIKIISSVVTELKYTI